MTTDAKYLDEINPHLALWQSETRTWPDEQNWIKWCEELAAALNVPNLDGDDDVDGYSLDHAFDFYNANLTVDEAADEFRAIMAGREDRQ